MPGAVVLLSGGLDSSTVLYMARERGFQLHALSFDYGQRHRIELERAGRQAQAADCAAHVVVRIDPVLFSGTALVGTDVAVPRGRDIDNSIPVTYVPGRNILFLAHALSYAESRQIVDIFIGANALDYSGYPDCRPEFFEAFSRMAHLGTRAGSMGGSPQIHAPLLKMTKAAIIREGLRLGVDYAATTSCYDPGPEGRPCGGCDSCVLRAKGFREAGSPDPLGDGHSQVS